MVPVSWSHWSSTEMADWLWESVSEGVKCEASQLVPSLSFLIASVSTSFLFSFLSFKSWSVFVCSYVKPPKGNNCPQVSEFCFWSLNLISQWKIKTKKAVLFQCHCNNAKDELWFALLGLQSHFLTLSLLLETWDIVRSQTRSLVAQGQGLLREEKLVKSSSYLIPLLQCDRAPSSRSSKLNTRLLK